MIGFMKMCGFEYATPRSGIRVFYGHGYQVNGLYCGPMDSPNELICVSEIVNGSAENSVEYPSFSAMIEEESRLDFTKALTKYIA